MAERADAEPASIRWSFVRHWGDARLIMIDSRAGRVLEEQHRRMVDDDEFAWIEAAMQRVGRPRACEHLIIGTSLPWLLPHAIHNLERWNETLNVRHEGRVAGPAGREAAAGGRPGALGGVRRLLRAAGPGADVGRPRRARAGAGDGAGALRRRPPRLRRRAGAPGRPDRAGAPADRLPAAQPGAAPDPGRLPDRLEPVGAAVHRGLARLAKAEPSALEWEKQAGPFFGNQIGELVLTGREARFRLSVTELGQDGPAAGARHAARAGPDRLAAR